MDVLVCVQQVPDPVGRLGYQPDGTAVDQKGWRYILNPCDEHAVEEAIRLRERLGTGRVVVVTSGPEGAERIIRYCLAMGADHGIHVCEEGAEEWDVMWTARVLARALSIQGFGLVLCGRQTIGWGSGTVGAAIAELLGIPMVSGIARLDITSDRQSAVVERIAEYGGREIIRCPLPALFTVDAAINSPRYVSVRSQRQVLHRDIARWGISQLGLCPDRVSPASSKVTIVELSAPKPKKVFTPASTLPAAERMRLVMSGGLTVEKKGDFLTGSSEEIAAQVVDCLIAQRVIRVAQGR